MMKPRIPVMDAGLLRPTSARRSTAGVATGVVVSERTNLLRLRALLALGDLELDSLVLFQSAVAARLDGREVDEHVRTSAIDRDETEALVCVEPLHGSLRHADLSFGKCRPSDARPLAVSEQRRPGGDRSFRRAQPSGTRGLAGPAAGGDSTPPNPKTRTPYPQNSPQN